MDVAVNSDGIAVDPSGLTEALGIVGAFTLPWSDVAGVTVDSDPIRLVHGMRVGVGLPSTKVGTFRHDGVVDYVCIHKDGPAIVIDCRPGARFARLVLTVAEADSVAAAIRSHLSGPV